MTKSIEFSQLAPSPSGAPWMMIQRGVLAAINTLVPLLKRRFELARQRHQLAQLDDAQLLDIGVSRAEALAEAARPLSDDPLSENSLGQVFPNKHNRFWL